MENQSVTPQQTAKRNALWLFFNSGLGIWFLSTIVIGLFTFLFNEYSHNKTIKAEREIKVKQLDLEIESRISQFWVHLAPIVIKNDTTYQLINGIKFDTVRVFWEAFRNPPSFNPKLMTTIYKEYESRTTISLMIELSSLLRDKYDLELSVKKASTDTNSTAKVVPVPKEKIPILNEIRDIEDAAIFIGGNGIFYDSNNPSIEAIWNKFYNVIILDRWRTRFPYTDCLFC